MNQSIRSAFAVLLWGMYFLDAILFAFLGTWIARHILRRPWNKAYASGKLFASLGLRIFGIDIELQNPHGVDLRLPYILAANHRSWFDQLALMHVHPVPFHILSKKGYFDIPIFGKAMRDLECIPVEDQTISLETHESITHYLERGDSILFFVEGTRGTGKQLLPFRPGAFKYAAHFQRPVLPITILGSEEILCKHRSMLSVKSGKIIVRIDPPIVFPRGKTHREAVEQFEAAYRNQHDQLYDQTYGMNGGIA